MFFRPPLYNLLKQARYFNYGGNGGYYSPAAAPVQRPVMRPYRNPATGMTTYIHQGGGSMDEEGNMYDNDGNMYEYDRETTERMHVPSKFYYTPQGIVQSEYYNPEYNQPPKNWMLAKDVKGGDGTMDDMQRNWEGWNARRQKSQNWGAMYDQSEAPAMTAAEARATNAGLANMEEPRSYYNYADQHGKITPLSSKINNPDSMGMRYLGTTNDKGFKGMYSENVPITSYNDYRPAQEIRRSYEPTRAEVGATRTKIGTIPTDPSTYQFKNNPNYTRDTSEDAKYRNARAAELLASSTGTPVNYDTPPVNTAPPKHWSNLNKGTTASNRPTVNNTAPKSAPRPAPVNRTQTNQAPINKPATLPKTHDNMSSETVTMNGGKKVKITEGVTSFRNESAPPDFKTKDSGEFTPFNPNLYPRR